MGKFGRALPGLNCRPLPAARQRFASLCLLALTAVVMAHCSDPAAPPADALLAADGAGSGDAATLTDSGATAADGQWAAAEIASPSDTGPVDAGTARNPALPQPKLVVLSEQTMPTKAERAQWQADIAAGKDFDAFRLRPDVTVAPQAVNNAVVLTKTEMRMPAAGNAAVLAWPKGKVIFGERADPAKRAAKGNNVFGYVRKVVSAAQVGDEIVVQTAPAGLQDALLGAAQFSAYKPGPAQKIDTQNADLSPFQTDEQNARDKQRAAAQAQQAPAGFDTQRGAWTVADFDETFDLLGFGTPFDLDVDNFAQEIKGIVKDGELKKASLEGDLRAVGSFSYKPSFRGALTVDVDVDIGWDPSKWVSITVQNFVASTALSAHLDIALKPYAQGKTSDGPSPDVYLQKSYTKTKTFALGKFVEIGPYLGAIPTSFVVENYLECDFEAMASASINTSGKVAFDGELGIRYDGDKWHNIKNLKFDKAYDFKLSGGGVRARCSYLTEVWWKIADIGGPFSLTGPYVEGLAEVVSICPESTGTAKQQPAEGYLTKKVAAGFDANYGFGIDLKVYTFKHKEDLYDKAWTLYESGSSVPGFGVCGTNCTNNKKDNAETDVDCGGAPGSKSPPYCPQCGSGKKCKYNIDCAAPNYCKSGECFPVNCKDGSKGPGEAGVDCGDKCGVGCPIGNDCVVSDDCTTKNCVGFKCTVPSCTNKVLDNNESLVDVGPACPKVDGGGTCADDANCKSGICLPKLPQAAVSTGFCGQAVCPLNQWMALFDGKHSAGFGETDIDCGGPCAKVLIPKDACSKYGACGEDVALCGYDQKCLLHSECKSGNCDPQTGKCGAQSCGDGKKNGSEPDVDCGGTCYTRCAKGKSCYSTKDCAAPLACNPKKKCASACFDLVLSGAESDIDCGGACFAKCPLSKKCNSHADCKTGLGCANSDGGGKTCQDLCFDGQRNGTETDVDCGGTCAKKCANDQFCTIDTDCVVGHCGKKVGGVVETSADGYWKCTPMCENGFQNTPEPVLDKGNACPVKCTQSEPCYQHGDCATQYCAPDKKCRVPSCSDQWLNGKESDVDCGAACGSAKLCTKGAACKAADDCADGPCTAGKCVGHPCKDGILGPEEADIDCGGGTAPYLCAACAVGKKCTKNAQCKSQQCIDNKCAYVPCKDEVLTPGESDVDCGGTCSAQGFACPLGKKCTKNFDCQSGWCNGTVCVANSCETGQLDDLEADVDCGGPCATKCKLMLACNVGSDCASGACAAYSYVCVASGCVDQIKSGTETDADCGGACPTKCKVKQGCKTGADCATGVCNGSVCVQDSCADKVKNGAETDVDCGGSCGKKCATGATCKAGSDCASTVCGKSGTCVLTTCDDGLLTANETDVDCGGTCSTLCVVGKGCNANGDCAGGLCGKAGLCVGSTCDLCDANATCNGGKTCACKAGFAGDGLVCWTVTATTPLNLAPSLGKPVNLATVQNAKAAATTWTAALASGSGATQNGISISGLQVDAAGVVSGQVAATCTATKASFDLEVTAKNGGKVTVAVSMTVVGCDDGNACTADTCDQATGCKNSSDGVQCDDGNLCTSGDACTNGTCKAGTTVDCSTSGLVPNACQTPASCGATTGKCALGDKPKGAPCSDGSKCTDVDACDTGACKPGAAVVCDDKNPCTSDSCSPTDGCQFVANTAACDDDNGCTKSDTCANSACKGTVTCAADATCSGSGASAFCKCNTGFLGNGYTCASPGTTFSCTGAVQVYTVPAGVTKLDIELHGGGGGGGGDSMFVGGAGGGGGQVTITNYAIGSGQKLYIIAGCGGAGGTSACQASGPPENNFGVGGHLGGGNGGYSGAQGCPNSHSGGGGGGGGLSGVFSSASPSAVTAIAIAGGGGGGGGGGGFTEYDPQTGDAPTGTAGGSAASGPFGKGATGTSAGGICPSGGGPGGGGGGGSGYQSGDGGASGMLFFCENSGDGGTGGSSYKASNLTAVLKAGGGAAGGVLSGPPPFNGSHGKVVITTK